MGSWALLPQGCLDDPAAAACSFPVDSTLDGFGMGEETQGTAQDRAGLAEGGRAIFFGSSRWDEL